MHDDLILLLSDNNDQKHLSEYVFNNRADNIHLAVN